MSPEAEVQTQPTTSGPTRETSLDLAIESACSFLMSSQCEEGYWIAELEADTTLESDYITYLHVLGKFESLRIATLAR
jgi:nitrogen fixation protein FixH